MSAKSIFTLLGVAALTGIAGLYAIDEFIGPSYPERKRRQAEKKKQQDSASGMVAQMESVQEPEVPQSPAPYKLPEFNMQFRPDTAEKENESKDSKNSSRRDISSVDGNDKSDVIFEFADEIPSDDDTAA